MKFWTIVFCSVALLGCSSNAGKIDKVPNPDAESGDNANATRPSFTVATSEYPSWSTLLVADMLGVINGKKDKVGPVEEKWGVDIVVKEADYDTCLTLYGSGNVDADCQTNMDSLAPAIGRSSVAICPTSTSVGADACVVVNINSIEDLKSKVTYGLEKSVSQFAFERSLKNKGFNPADFKFKNMDPAAAAQAVQTSQDNVTSIQVWNPFVMQTLRTREGAKVLFDTTEMPEEIIDLIVVGKDSLQKEGGENFACALIDTFYEVNRRLGPALGKEHITEQQAKTLVGSMTDDQKQTLVALGAKFSNLPAEDMAICTRQTRFYANADQGLELFARKAFQSDTMPMVINFCVDNKIVDKRPDVDFGDYKNSTAQLVFDPQFMQKVASKK